MAITFECPHCQSSLHAVSDLAGKPSSCPKCNQEVTVPQQVETQSKDKETAAKE
jgi:hypothetical protein